MFDYKLIFRYVLVVVLGWSGPQAVVMKPLVDSEEFIMGTFLDGMCGRFESQLVSFE